MVAGSGNALNEMIEIAHLKGADVIVSGDIRDSKARYASELGIAVIDAGSYYTEKPGMKKLAERLQEEVREEISIEYLDPGSAWDFI